MFRRAFFLLVLPVIGCAAEPSETTSDSNDALSGNVAVGKVVTVHGDALRLRKTPDLSNLKNVIGLLPINSQVRITSAAPQNGFYQVDVLTSSVAKKLGASSGWVYGSYINGKAKDPIDTTVDDGNGTGSWNAPTQAKVDFVVADCSTLKDDQGKAMAPTIEDFMSSDQPYAVIGIDTNTFSYGMTASIAELNAKSAFNPGGVNIPLKIVKTATTQPDAGFTVTLCMKDAMNLPTDSGQLNLTVYPDPQ
jgi:hypothetical protein